MNPLDAWAALNPAGHHAAWLMLNLLWQSSLVLLTAGAAAWLLRRRSAALRAIVWTAAILLLPLLPLLGYVGQRAEAPRAPVTLTALDLPVEVDPGTDVPLQPANSGAPAFSAPAPSSAASEPAIVQLVRRPWTLVLVVYALGLLRLLGAMLIGIVQLHRWVRTATPVADERVLTTFARAHARLHGHSGTSSNLPVSQSPSLPVSSTRRMPRILLSDRVTTPLTVGLLRPIVLLPKDSLSSVSVEDLERIALHELAHLQRRDPLLLRLTLLVRAALFFQSLLWLAHRRLALLAEHACDERVVELTSSPAAYAKLLADMAERSHTPAFSTRMATGLLLGKRAFVVRVEAILDEGWERARKLSKPGKVALVLALVLAVVAAAAVPLAEASKEKTNADVQEAPAATSVSIAGKVISEKGEPVAGAKVYACALDPKTLAMVQHAQTLADEQGRFEFEALPVKQLDEWQYEVYAWRQGHAWGSATAGCWIHQLKGAVTKVIDVEVKLCVPASFRGRVLDTEGKPVRGARISGIFQGPAPQHSFLYYVWTGGSFGSVVTDAQGRFELQDVPSNSELRIAVEAGGFATIGVNRVGVKGAGRLDPFPVPGPDVEIRLEPASKITGVLLSAATGKPVAEATIRAFEKDLLQGTYVRTDPDGRFTLEGLPAGCHFVSGAIDDRASYLIKDEAVTLLKGEMREGVVLKLEEGIEVTGRVISETAKTPVTRGLASLSDGVEIYLEKRLDQTGAFRFRVLPGEYRLAVRAAGFQHHPPVELSVKAGGTTHRQNFALQPKTCQVQVLDKDGRPLAGAKVRLARIAETFIVPPDGNVDISDQDRGWFEGEKIEVASADGKRIGCALITRADVAQTSIEKRVALREPCSITGVVRTPDGKPAASIPVSYAWSYSDQFTQENRNIATTDAQGRYTLSGLYPEQEYTVLANAVTDSPFGMVRSAKVLMLPGASFGCPELVLPKADLVLKGQVLDDAGRPLAAVRVNVQSPSNCYRDVKTDEQGRFEVRNIVGETTSVSVFDPPNGLAPWVRNNMVDKEEMDKVVIRLKRK